jgi:hypothetical protein
MSASLGLNAAQHRAIAALRAGADQEKAAISAGKSVRTISRWCRDGKFRSALAERSRQIADAAVQHLQAGALGAAKALVSMAGGELPPTSARVAACRATLELVRDSTQIANLEEMVSELSARVEQTRSPAMSKVLS